MKRDRSFMPLYPSLVSVILPHYNSSMYLESALLSVMRQSHPDIEIIVVDDCSDEEHFRKAKEICQQYDIDIHRLEVNSGPARARNEGILRSKGNWLLFLDADDLLTPHSIAHRLKAARPGTVWITGIMWRVPVWQKGLSPAAIIRGAFVSVSTIRNANIAKTAHYLLWNRLPKPWSVFGIHANLFAREAFIRFGLFDEELRLGEDTEFGDRMQLVAGIAPVRRFRVVALYRQHVSQTTVRIKDSRQHDLRQHNLDRRRTEGIRPENTRCYPEEHASNNPPP
jgi:glycosyltransferase involved in cell wall biosynthesis